MGGYDFYIGKNGKAIGPFTGEQLQQMRDAGSVSGEDPAWRKGLSEWRPVSTIVRAAQPPPIPQHGIVPSLVAPSKIPPLPTEDDSGHTRAPADDRPRLIMQSIGNFFLPEGRIGRASFIVRTSALLVTVWLIAVISNATIHGAKTDVVVGLLALIILCAIAVQAGKRLHDKGSPAGWVFAVVTGLEMLILPFVLLIAPGTSGPNRFGPEPTSIKGVKVAAWTIMGCSFVLTLGLLAIGVVSDLPHNKRAASESATPRPIATPISSLPSPLQARHTTGSADQVYATCADNDVTLDVYDPVVIPARQGSGVVIENETGNEDGALLRGPWILTNYHVIANAGLLTSHRVTAPKATVGWCSLTASRTWH